MSVLHTYLIQEKFISRSSSSLCTRLHFHAAAHMKLQAAECSAQRHISFSRWGQEHRLSFTPPRLRLKTNEGIPARLRSRCLDHFHSVGWWRWDLTVRWEDRSNSQTQFQTHKTRRVSIMRWKRTALGWILCGLMSPLRTLKTRVKVSVK